MKNLPKYFVIKRVHNSELWEKYIQWLNEYSNEGSSGILNFDGSCAYYGRDGRIQRNWCGYGDNIDRFKNNPTEITLEQWNKCINGEEFELGEQIGVSCTNKECAISGLKYDSYIYYYTGGVDKNGKHIIERNDGRFSSFKYIAKIPKEETIKWKSEDGKIISLSLSKAKELGLIVK